MPPIQDTTLTSIFSNIDLALLKEWDIHQGGKLLTIPFDPNIKIPESHDFYCSKILMAVMDIIMTQEASIAAPRPSKEARHKNKTLMSFLIYNITHEQAAFLLERGVWSWRTITFRVAPFKVTCPTFLSCTNHANRSCIGPLSSCSRHADGRSTLYSKHRTLRTSCSSQGSGGSVIRVSALLQHPILLFSYFLLPSALLSCARFPNIPKSFPVLSDLNAFPNVLPIVVLPVHAGTTLFFGKTLWYIPKFLVHECHLLTISLYQTCPAPVTLRGLLKHKNWHLNTLRGYTTVLRKVLFCPFHTRGNKAKSVHTPNHHTRPTPLKHLRILHSMNPLQTPLTLKPMTIWSSLASRLRELVLRLALCNLCTKHSLVLGVPKNVQNVTNLAHRP